MWVPSSQRVSLWASGEMVCFGILEEVHGIYWDHTCVLCARQAETWQRGVILDSSLSHPTSSPSINHVSSTFNTYLEFDLPHHLP